MRRHVVLLGDSIFDNQVYVQPDEPAVIDQLQALLPHGSSATLLAVDGAVMSDLARQIDDLPRDATHLIVSVGGNDAIGYSSILGRRVNSAQEVFDELAEVHRQFRLEYRAMLRAILQRELPTAVCTVYDQIPMADPDLRRHVGIALTPFNDAILREAARVGLPVLDLRTICDTKHDFSLVSPIEPSAAGGQKICRAILQLLDTHDFRSDRITIYGYSAASRETS